MMAVSWPQVMRMPHSTTPLQVLTSPKLLASRWCTGTPLIAHTSGASDTVRNRAMLIWEVEIRCRMDPAACKPQP